MSRTATIRIERDALERGARQFVRAWRTRSAATLNLCIGMSIP